MPAPVEIELKLALPEKALRQVQAAPILKQAEARSKSEQLTSIYFDTGKLKLKKSGFSLRVRTDGRQHVQTIKSDLALSSSPTERREWEAEIKGDTPDATEVRAAEFKSILPKKRWRKLRPVFETDVERRTFMVRSRGTLVELAVDRGRIKADGESDEICEIELELKEGDRSELFRIAHELANEAPLRLEVRSKAARGYSLLAGTTHDSVGSTKVTLDPDATMAEAFQAIAESCLYQVAANWDAVCNEDPEGVHDMRVGLRRLRSAMSLFSEIVGDDQSQHIKEELKWLTDELGPARQLHVFATTSIKQMRDAHTEDDQALAELDEELDRRRKEVEARAKAAVSSDRFRNLLLGAAQWIEKGAWLTTEDELIGKFRKRPIRDVAEKILARRTNKIVKRGGNLRELDPQKRHKLRIAAKKLRYGSEFFADLFTSAKAQAKRRAFVKKLKTLQDSLGHLNDVSADLDLSRAIAREAKNCKDPQDVAYLIGAVVGREEVQSEPLLDDGVRAHRQFSQTAPFW